jgi:hypothetical protein
MESAARETRATPGRIFVGVWEISNIVFTIAEALRSGGYEVETLLIDTPFNCYYQDNRYDDRVRWPRGDRFYRSPIDRTRFNLQMAKRLVRAARHCDTFVFIWRYSFLPFQLDIPLLRALGKRVVVFWCGDDVRYKPIQVELDSRRLDTPWFPTSPHEQREWTKWGRSFSEAFWTTKLVEHSGATIVAPRDASTLQGRRYSNFVIPQRSLVPGPREPSDEPLVVHAPSDPVLKGTPYVEEAVRRLREEGVRFRFELVHGMPIDGLHQLLRRADIVIDQPGVWVGRLGIESMAAGAVVVGGNQPDYWGFPDASPVQQFVRDSGRLTATLRRLLTDTTARGRLMAESYDYVERVYSYGAFVGFFDELLAGRYLYPLDPLPDQRALALEFAPGLAGKAAVSLLW